MSNHDDLGHDGDLGPGREVLRQTIDALVDGATPRDVPSAPEVNLGLLRRRVRTWRVAKAGAVGLSTAAVVGALAFSAAQATTWNRAEPLPGRPTIESTETGPVPSEIPTSRVSQSPTATASPTPSATPSSTPDPTPSGEADVAPTGEPSASATGEPAGVITAPFDDGYRAWSEDYPVWCGMPDADLVSTSPSVSIEITGDLVYERGEGGTIPVRLTGEMPGYVTPGSPGDTEVIGDAALLVWSQGGRVVDMGLAWREGNYEIPPALNDTGVWTGDAYAQSFSSCIEADKVEYGLSYDNVRTAGTYQVRAVQAHSIGDTGTADGAEDYFVVSDPVTVTIP